MSALQRTTRQTFLCSLLLIAGLSGALAQKTPEFVYPATPFNEAEAAKQMEEGTATIAGIAKIKKKGRTYFPWQKDQINLFPATAYIMEFAELKKKYTKGKKIATITNDAFTYRIEGRTTDDRGSFEFRNLKPGKYYIVTWIDYEKQYETKERTGTDYAFNQYGNMVASYPTYTYYTHKYTVEMEVSGIVEVKADGEKVTVVITN
ncbi:hypothetical protein D3H65_09310 [Paraflavitalea soli]|uniref:Carboxypeptidase regulatory-like domain-containing protein n=1 Tax=Paraflavitalea soli TaxID=2315862 RepID=A0A3B7MLI0_9BACT|nr:hypothetical protein [Paraflavitalea soli]AXY74159.1 hypothetical protein D3H65_09310 [Paraflavitalea soli]